MKKIRFSVLLCDDDESILGALKHLLEYEGFLVFEAENGVEALEKLKILLPAGEPDLILTDVQMPFDGEKLIERLKTMEKLGNIPIIPMSSGGMSHISGKKVMPKPLDLHALIETIRTTIAQDRHERHLDNGDT